MGYNPNGNSGSVSPTTDLVVKSLKVTDVNGIHRTDANGDVWKETQNVAGDVTRDKVVEE